MKSNIHRLDKAIRMVIGTIFIVLTVKLYKEDFHLGTMFAVLSLYLFASSLTGICPVYMFLEVNTKKSKKRKRFY